MQVGLYSSIGYGYSRQNIAALLIKVFIMYLISSFVNPYDKSELSNHQTNTQIDVYVVAHIP